MAGACNVKTVDGQCCSFPFLYKGNEQNLCIKGITTDRKWCGTTYYYDQDKKWGWCPSEGGFFRRTRKVTVTIVTILNNAASHSTPSKPALNVGL